MFYPNFKPLPLHEAQHLFHLQQFHPTFHQPHGYMHAYMHAGGWRRHPQVSVSGHAPGSVVKVSADHVLVWIHGDPSLCRRRGTWEDHDENEAAGWIHDAIITSVTKSYPNHEETRYCESLHSTPPHALVRIHGKSLSIA
jgi:hypothetical protein